MGGGCAGFARTIGAGKGYGIRADKTLSRSVGVLTVGSHADRSVARNARGGIDQSSSVMGRHGSREAGGQRSTRILG